MPVRLSDNATRRTLAAGSLAIAIALLPLQGCTTTPAADAGRTTQVLTASDTEFAEGANRPPTARTLYGLAQLMQAKGKQAEYELVLARLIQRYPAFKPAYLDLAQLKLRQGRLTEAIAVLERGTSYDENDPVLANNLGMCRMMNGDHEGALTAFEQAVTLTPNNTRYVGNMAVALGMLGHYEDCLAAYNTIVEPAQAHYNLAVICEARHDMERATEAYARARELNPALKRQDFRPMPPTMTETFGAAEPREPGEMDTSLAQ